MTREEMVQRLRRVVRMSGAELHNKLALNDRQRNTKLRLFKKSAALNATSQISVTIKDADGKPGFEEFSTDFVVVDWKTFRTAMLYLGALP